MTARSSLAAATAFLLAGCRASLPLSDAIEPQAVLRAMTTVADWQLASTTPE